MKQLGIALLNAPNLKDLILDPERTRTIVDNILSRWKSAGDRCIYRVEYTGTYDGALWELTRVRGPNGELCYPSRSAWTAFVFYQMRTGINRHLGLSPSVPKVDLQLGPDQDDASLTPFALARNLMPIEELVKRDHLFFNLSVIIDGNQRWHSRPDDLGATKTGTVKWAEMANEFLKPFLSWHAISLTLFTSRKHVIPERYVPSDFVEPERGGW